MFRKGMVSLLALSLASLTAVPAPPTPPRPRSAAELVLLRHCKAEYRYATELGAPAQGILQDCLVEMGDKVKAGQVLGRLHDRAQRAEMERAKFEAESIATIKTAESRFNLARTKHRYARDLHRRNAIGKEEYEVAQQEEETARLALEEVKVAHRVAELRYKQAEVAVRSREIVSPHDGVVVQISRRPGEAVSNVSSPNSVMHRPGELGSLSKDSPSKEPIFRVVNTETVRVTGYLDAGDVWRVRTGQSVRVTVETVGPALPIQSEVFTGQVVFVDSEIDPRTRTCRVMADVKNRKGLLRAGLDLQMEIVLGSGTPPASAVH